MAETIEKVVMDTPVDAPVEKDSAEVPTPPEQSASPTDDVRDKGVDQSDAAPQSNVAKPADDNGLLKGDVTETESANDDEKKEQPDLAAGSGPAETALSNAGADISPSSSSKERRKGGAGLQKSAKKKKVPGAKKTQGQKSLNSEQQIQSLRKALDQVYAETNKTTPPDIQLIRELCLAALQKANFVADESPGDKSGGRQRRTGFRQSRYGHRSGIRRRHRHDRSSQSKNVYSEGSPVDSEADTGVADLDRSSPAKTAVPVTAKRRGRNNFPESGFGGRAGKRNRRGNQDKRGLDQYTGSREKPISRNFMQFGFPGQHGPIMGFEPNRGHASVNVPWSNNYLAPSHPLQQNFLGTNAMRNHSLLHMIKPTMKHPAPKENPQRMAFPISVYGSSPAKSPDHPVQTKIRELLREAETAGEIETAIKMAQDHKLDYIVGTAKKKLATLNGEQPTKDE